MAGGDGPAGRLLTDGGRDEPLRHDGGVDAAAPDGMDEGWQSAGGDGDAGDGGAEGAGAGADPQGGSGAILPTGIEALDRRLGGGIPAGRMVALMAPPDAQSELLLWTLAAQRDTVFVSTLRPRWEVREEAAAALPDPERVEIEAIRPDTLLDDPQPLLDRIESGSNVILDCVDGLERDSERRYHRFLNELKRALRQTDSLALLHGVQGSSEPPSRGLTLQRADLVWNLELTVDVASIEYRLVVPKFRGGSALTEPVKLRLTDEVRVDTSRDIA